MRLQKSFQLALNIFVHSKLRSWLTIIGIIVGIAAVVAILSISLGMQKELQNRLGDLGADVLTVSSGVQRAFGGDFGENRGPGGEGGASSTSINTKNLTAKDVLAIRSVSNVKFVMGQVSGKADVTYSTKTSKNMNVNGVDVNFWKDITSEQIGSGRLLALGDSYSVVIGKTLADSVFGKEIPINTKIIIGGKSFNVVGILTEGRSVYIPIDIARNTLSDVGKYEFDSISVKISDVSISNQTVTDITNKLMLSRGILNDKSRDFSVSNPATMQATIQSTLNMLTLFLGAIAAISLIVGGIGIANTMFTSVLEKTKEIGIMKAIGTQNKDIMNIFLINSGLIGMVGGTGGVIIGILSSKLISSFAGITSPSTYEVSLIVFGAILFAVLIGMIAGAIPAYRASKLNPVDALRYE